MQLTLHRNQKMKHRKLDPDYLRQCFSYDAQSGVLTWRVRPREHFKGGAGWHNFNNQFANLPAGSKGDNGYIDVKINCTGYPIARVIWAIQTGQSEFDLVDHIDGDPTNTRMSNLRLATFAENTRNRSHKANNSSGVRGVTWHKPSRKWWARVTLNDKTHSLGLYKTIEEATVVVYEAKQQMFGEFARA
jgi:hypothetical protein